MRAKVFKDAAAVGDVAGAAAGGGNGAALDEADGDGSDAVQVKQEIARPPIFDHFQEASCTLITAGPARGKWQLKFKCNVLTSSGVCGGSVTCYKSGEGKALTTSNAWEHLRKKAEKCSAHATALAKLNATNRNCVQLEDGEFVKVMSFAEAFPHHVDYVWCRARGIFSAALGSKPLFRKYVRGYEPRAVFPHHEVQYNIALCIKELQDEEQLRRVAALQREFKYGPCIGVQLDMWTDPNTHIAYGGVNMTTVREPSTGIAASTSTAKKKAPPQLRVVSEVLDFDVFPNTEHTGTAIRDWFGDVLEKKGIRISSVSGATPDGASDGQLGLRLVTGLADKVDTCNLHGLQRSVLYSIGLAGSGAGKNSQLKAILKAHNRVAQLSNQSRAVSDGIRKAQIAADVPLSKLLSTVDTCTTRWGNQSQQVSRNNMLRPVIDPVVETFKRGQRRRRRWRERRHL